MPRTLAKSHDDQRRVILQCAAEAFAQTGYASASMQSLAVRCGVSKSLLYHYYASKDEILFEILRDVVGTLETVRDEVMRTALPPMRKAEALVHGWLNVYAHAKPQLTVLLNDRDHLPIVHANLIRDGERALVESLTACIAVAYKVPPQHATVLAMAVFGMINWTFTWLKPEGDVSYSQFADQVVALLRGGLPLATSTPLHP